MILYRYTSRGEREITDMHDHLLGASAFLVGGGPSLKAADLALLNQPGVVSMTMNNAALTHRSRYWISSDDPRCFATSILLDPGIMKFAPVGQATRPIRNGSQQKMHDCPGMLFYRQSDPPTWDRYLDRSRDVPWYNNTMLSAIHVLYQLGVRHIYMLGSELGKSTDGDSYAHGKTVPDMAARWSQDVYDALAEELRRLKPHFDAADLKITDCSNPSRLGAGSTYRCLNLKDAVDEVLEPLANCAADDEHLPHCSEFAGVDIREMIARWPAYDADTLHDAPGGEVIRG